MTNHANHLSGRSCFSEVDNRKVSRARASIQYSGSSEDIPITLRDVSVFGAGFFTSEPPQLRSRVMFTLRGQGQSERLRATIMWSLPAGEGWWRAGCRFEGQLSTDSIDIATVPERQATSIQFQIRRELDPEIRVAAKVVEFSDRGLCVRSAEAFPKGSKLLFETQEIDPPVRFVALVQWTQHDQDEFRMGCRFVGSCDLKAFRRCLPEFVGRSDSDDSEVDSETVRALSRIWAGVRSHLKVVRSAFSDEVDL